LAENISLKKSHCNILDLTDNVALIASPPDFSDLGYFSGHVLSKTKLVTTIFFCLFGKRRSLPFWVASFKKKMYVGTFLGVDVLNLDILRITGDSLKLLH